MYFLILFLYLLELYYRISGHHVSRFEALVMRKNEAIRPIIKGTLISGILFSWTSFKGFVNIIFITFLLSGGGRHTHSF